MCGSFQEVHREFLKINLGRRRRHWVVTNVVHQLTKDLGVMSKLEAKSSVNSRSVIRARKVCCDSWKLDFVIRSGQSLG